MQLTHEQIIQLAPDAASASAGKKLATTRKWQALHAHEKALWGDCQGSGVTPYKTIVDLGQMAFKCTCPSRKFPCKHSLALLFLYQAQSEVFQTEAELAPHVAEWLNRREARNQPKKEKPVDEKTQQKRIDQREKKIAAGLEELKFWIREAIRVGLDEVPSNAYRFTEKIAARMVDAQMPGLASRLRALSAIHFRGEQWPLVLVRELATIYLIAEAYERQAQLSPDWQAEIRNLVGWNVAKEEVLRREGRPDDWQILARQLHTDENLTVEKIWLWGNQHQQFALLLNFYAFNQKPLLNLVPGLAFRGEMAFYPAVWPLRSLIKSHLDDFKAINASGWPKPRLEALPVMVTEKLALNPFLMDIPLLVGSVAIRWHQQKWFLFQDDYLLPLQNPSDELWQVLAATQGKAFDGFLVYQQQRYYLLAYHFDHNFYPLAN